MRRRADGVSVSDTSFFAIEACTAIILLDPQKDGIAYADLKLFDLAIQDFEAAFTLER